MPAGVKPGATGKAQAAAAAAPASDDAAAKLAANMATMQGASGPQAAVPGKGKGSAAPAEAAPAEAAPSAVPAAAPAREPARPLQEVEDSQLEKLCQKLGLSKVRGWLWMAVLGRDERAGKS